MALVLLVILMVSGVTFAIIARGSPAIRMDQARQCNQRGQTRRSIAILRNIVADTPDNNSARWLLANLLEKQDATVDALEAVRPLLESLPPEATLGEVLGLATRCLLAHGEVSDARTLLETKGASFLPGSDAPNRSANVHDTVDISASADAMIILKLHAETAERCGDIAPALASWRALENWRDLDPAEHLAYGRLLARAQRTDEAIPQLEQAHKGLPSSSEAARLLAERLTAAGRHADAHRLYRQIFLDATGRERVTVGLKFAAALEDVGNPRGAIDILEQVIGMPKCARGEAADALCQIGDLWQKMENPTEAKQSWERAFTLWSDHPGACRRLGRTPRPQSSQQLIDYIRKLPPESFRKLFERILSDWGYTLESVREVDRDTLHIVVTRFENGKDRKKLVTVTRWENEVGQFPVQDLKLEVLDKKYDTGVFIAMSHYSTNAMKFARHSGCLELFSTAELMPLMAHIELPQ